MTHDDQDESRLKEEALMEFNYAFAEYVRGMNEDLWHKAVDFAASMTKYPGVEFGQPGSTG
jgi:hypothetical protein